MGGQMDTINELVSEEWKQFQQVNNNGGRASCQDDARSFAINRAAQFMTWDEETRQSYLRDLRKAAASGWNLLTEKYARMMRDTDPEGYVGLCDRLPSMSHIKVLSVERILSIQLIWQKEFMEKYPNTAMGSRPLKTPHDEYYSAGFRTYLRCELSTYSDETIALYLRHVKKMQAEGKNMTIMNLENVARMYGFSSLQEMEDRAERKNTAG